MQFLNKLKDNKDILFGAFSDKLKKQDKVEKWKEMAVLAQSICLAPADKDWTYIRDTVWQNLKKTAMVSINLTCDRCYSVFILIISLKSITRRKLELAE